MIPARTRWAAALNALPLPRRPTRTSDTILLAGTPRSGTTWLGQTISAVDGLALVNEPLGLKMPGLERAGLSWSTWRPPHESWPEGERVLQQFFTGRRMTLKLLLRNRLGALSYDGLVIKEVKANRLLPWIAEHFDLRGIVHLIRHPCAVVSSQIAHFPVRDPCIRDNWRYLEHCRPELLSWARGLKTEWEERALTWALDQFVPLRVKEPRPWLTVHYETLVMNGESEVRRVFEALGLDFTATVQDALSSNSWQVREHSIDHGRATAAARLGVWQARLSPAQIQDILEVCDRCGLRLYGEGLEPLST